MKIIEKTAEQMMGFFEKYTFRQLLTGEECALRWDRDENLLCATYVDGHTERYVNTEKCLSLFVAVRLARAQESDLVGSVSQEARDAVKDMPHSKPPIILRSH